MAGSIFKSSMALSFATMLSRILGLFREILFASILGGGMLMSAWTCAQMIPNLFRRLLGEGALGSALIPMITHTIEQDGRDKARQDFSTISTWLFFLLTLITVIVSAGALLAYPLATVDRVRYVLLTTPVIMPYCILICMIGVFTSMLNVFKIFFWPAIASLSLNVFLILSLILICPHYIDQPLKLLHILAITVLCSGVVAIIFLCILLKKQEMLPVVSWKNVCNKPAVREIIRLAIPGLIGAGVLEIGAIIDQSLSMYLHDSASAAIYYSNRLVYLPIGVFAVAFGTVSLPYLSHLAVENKLKSMLIQIFRSLRQLLFITVPMGAFLAFFGLEALSILFKRGRFDAEALNQAYLAFFYLTLGMPFYACLKLTVTGFYARKSMIIPAVVAGSCVIINLCLSLCLMGSLRQGGLTLATAISSCMNNVILLLILKRQLGRMPLWITCEYLFLTVVIAFISAAPAKFAYRLIDRIDIPLPSCVPNELLPFIGAGFVFCLVYMVIAMMMRIKEANIVLKKILRRK